MEDALPLGVQLVTQAISLRQKARVKPVMTHYCTAQSVAQRLPAQLANMSHLQSTKAALVNATAQDYQICQLHQQGCASAMQATTWTQHSVACLANI